jgi:hypothetical protein
MFYKATQDDGFDFRTHTVDYAGAFDSGEVVRHPSRPGRMIPDEPSTYLSVSVEPAETLIGGWWPCRLFCVEPEGDVLDGLAASPYKRACLALRVVEEMPAWQALGPNGRAVAALIQQAAEVTSRQAHAMAAARDAALDAAWDGVGTRRRARRGVRSIGRGMGRGVGRGMGRGMGRGGARSAGPDNRRAVRDTGGSVGVRHGARGSGRQPCTVTTRQERRHPWELRSSYLVRGTAPVTVAKGSPPSFVPLPMTGGTACSRHAPKGAMPRFGCWSAATPNLP